MPLADGDMRFGRADAIAELACRVQPQRIKLAKPQSFAFIHSFIHSFIHLYYMHANMHPMSMLYGEKIHPSTTTTIVNDFYKRRLCGEGVDLNYGLIAEIQTEYSIFFASKS